MYTKQEIILCSHRDGKSQRQISIELGVSRKTVRKYITEYESSLKGLDSTKEVISDYLLKPPEYDISKRVKLKLTQEVQEKIDFYLELNQNKLSTGQHKQQMKKIDILEQLEKEGIDIGYTTVCNYIYNKQQKNKEAYIRQEYIPGEVCEFDWGELKLTIEGQLRIIQIAVFTSAYSNYRYGILYNRQDGLSFMDSHIKFFLYTGYVYKQMVYDNMRVAVSRFVGTKEKEPTKNLLDLRGHYKFSHRFCNAYRGNEKGHVERSVEYIRRKAFSLKTEFLSIEEAQDHLNQILLMLNGKKQQQKGLSATLMFEQEKQFMQPSPPALVCKEQIELRVDKYSTISYKSNRYSVPDYLVGKFVDVYIKSHQIEIEYYNKIIAVHTRNYGKHQWTISIDHYLNTFKKKPGALSYSVALTSNEYLKYLFEEYFTDTPRDFIELLEYFTSNKITDKQLYDTIELLKKTSHRDITTEKLKALLGNTTENNPIQYDNEIAIYAQNQLKKVTELIG